MTDTSDLAFKSAVELIDLLRNRTISATELTRYFIDRIERYDTVLNAVVVRDFDRALDDARRADAHEADAHEADAHEADAHEAANNAISGSLQGLPVTVKESFDLAGLATTWGDPAAISNIAETDSVVVERLRRQGAVLLGKTNVPLNIGDFQSFNDIYDQTNNPWNLERTPGGSSGGCAAAVAAGLTGMGFGSDLGGSVRNPAHFCGVYSHKPTWGILPLRSQTRPGALSVPQELDMAVPGPIARSAEDLALAVSLLAGADELTAHAWKLRLPPAVHTSLKGMRIALWPRDDLAPVDEEISARIATLGSELSKRGAVVSDTARPDFEASDAWQTYRSLVLAMSGAPGDGTDYQQWLELNLKRGHFRTLWKSFFKSWDVLITPVTSTTAFPHDHSEPMSRTLQVNGKDRSYWEHVFWAGLATMSYLPATVFPSGLSSAGLPIGLQAIGPEFGDLGTIEFARLTTQEFGGFLPPGGFMS